ncbi:VOC family protein, partial [Roseateles sp. GG27B]
MTPVAARLADLPSVHSVDEFVFTVPDLAVARQFYSHFGLDVRDDQAGDALALFTFGHSQRWATVRQGTAKRLLWLSLGIHAQDEPRFERYLAERGIARRVAPAGADAGGLWIDGPDGLAIQLRVAAKCSPSQPAPREYPPENHNFGRAPSRSQAPAVRPLFLSHILLFSADVDAAVQFYSDILGLRLSDKSGSVIAFLHSPHGSDHHLLAFAKS